MRSHVELGNLRNIIANWSKDFAWPIDRRPSRGWWAVPLCMILVRPLPNPLRFQDAANASRQFGRGW